VTVALPEPQLGNSAIAESEVPSSIGTRIVLDDEAYDYHILVFPHCTNGDLAKAFALAEHLGYEVISPEESEPIVLPDGTRQIGLVPNDWGSE